MPVTDKTISAVCIPPTFPSILKQYAKAAIRTQPYDLLKWSATYFRALADGEVPPSKIRIEYDVYDTPSGLTPGYLKLLVKQLGTSGTVPQTVLFQKWTGVCLNESCLREMLKIGGFKDDVNWLQFLAIAAGHLTESLSGTMSLLCHLLTTEPVGGPPKIPCDTFTSLYAYLARLDCGPPEDETVHLDEEEQSVEILLNNDNSDENSMQSRDTIEKSEQDATSVDTVETKTSDRSEAHSIDNPYVPGIGPVVPEVQIQATIAYMQFWAAKQRGLVMPRNMDNYLCPSMNSDMDTRTEEITSLMAN